MTAEEVVAKLKRCQRNGEGWTARCPAHDDKTPSLSINEGAGRILIHCHAGCTPENVCAAIGINVADLFTGKPEAAPRQIVATYPYTDEASTLLFEVVRYSPKDFRQRAPNGKGGWTWSTKAVRKVLFRLPQVIEAVKAGRPVFICEGEKDCLAMEKAGFVATCNPGGACKEGGRKKWQESYTKTLAGADVIILPDRDEPGRKHAEHVAGEINGVARRVRVVELPDIGGRVKDAHDFFAAGGDVAQLQALVGAASDWKPQATMAAKSPEAETEYDFANLLAERLPPVITCGKRWHAYRGGAWTEIDRATLRPDAQNILPPHIRTARREGALLDHLEGRFQKSADSLAGFGKLTSAGEVLINAGNGIVRVKPTGEITLEAHAPDHLFTHKLVSNYHPEAKARLFQRVLGEVLNDPLDQNLFQLCAGNFILPDCRFETALVCYGEAGRGKSTLAEPMAEALGRALVPRLTMGQICDPKSYHVPKLQYAAVNLGTELDAIELGDSGAFKAIVSGEPVEARPIYAAPFTMQTTCKLWFLANGLPRFKHGTEAELRRTRFLRFDYLPPFKDVTLKARLAKERDGVFRWMLAGLVGLLSLPCIPLGGRHSKEVHERFKMSNDPIGSFVATRCLIDPAAQVTKEALRDAYAEFCEQHNLPASMDNWFLRNLYERWTQLREARPREDEGQRPRVILGIQLKP